MKRLILLALLLMSGCESAAQNTVRPTFQVVREDAYNTWDNRTVVLKSNRTGQCYIGVYNVGLIAVPATECAP